MLTRMLAVVVCCGSLAARASPDDVHLRGGLVTGLGAFVPGPMFTVTPLEGHLGAQLGPNFGLYATVGFSAGLGIGVDVSGNSAAAAVRAMGLRQAAVLADFTFGRFFISLGPTVANGGWAAAIAAANTSGQASATVFLVGDWVYGVKGKIGFGPAAGTSGFTVALDVSALVGEVISATANSSGSAAVAVGSKTVGFAPSILLGYEWK